MQTTEIPEVETSDFGLSVLSNISSFNEEENCTSTLNEQTEPIQPKITSGVSVLDVAAYILKKSGKLSSIKLQKLIYYCQAWSLVWDEEPLFHEPIEAWINGPVVRKLYNYHRGMFQISAVLTGNANLLNDEQKETIDSVLEFYGDKPAQWLIDLTHNEAPWKEARRGMDSTVRGNRAISLESMAEYYSSL